MKSVKYDPSEFSKVVAEYTAQGYVLREVADLLDGHFLTFLEPGEEAPARTIPADSKAALLAQIEDLKATVTDLTSQITDLKTQTQTMSEKVAAQEKSISELKAAAKG